MGQWSEHGDCCIALVTGAPTHTNQVSAGASFADFLAFVSPGGLSAWIGTGVRLQRLPRWRDKDNKCHTA